MTPSDLTPAEVRRQAFVAHKAGLCVVPPKEDGSKAPLGEWKEYQSQRPSESALDQWYSNGRTGLGVVCGAVSGNLETLDFDDRDTYLGFKELAKASGLGELVERIEAGCSDESPAAGIHWPYRCSEIGGNTKLARRPKVPEEMTHPEDKVKVLIETRGEGGFIITAPSYGDVHPSGRPYRLLRGGFETIAAITPEERTSLFELARTFDRMEKQTVKEPPPQKSSVSGLRPGDDFNARGDWANVLEPYGWRLVFERGEEGYWRRPGKDEGASATINFQGSDLLYVFSTSTPFDSERGYSKFSAYALLYHGGDYAAAAKTLSGMGYGDRPVSDDGGSESRTVPAQPKWPKPLAEEAYHALAGDAVRLIAPHTEADPPALLLNVLTMAGNVMGYEPHAEAEAARHGGNIDTVIVGETAKGRKGSSTGRA